MHKVYKTEEYLHQGLSVRLDNQLLKELTYLERRYRLNTSDLVRSIIHEKFEYEKNHVEIPIRITGGK